MKRIAAASAPSAARNNVMFGRVTAAVTAWPRPSPF
jgi:hypothetical protein